MVYLVIAEVALINCSNFLVEVSGIIRTGGDAGFTTDASIFNPVYLRMGGNAFGIMAPAAPQAAPFKKNRGPDAGPVVQGEFLDVEHVPAVIIGRYRTDADARSVDVIENDPLERRGEHGQVERDRGRHARVGHDVPAFAADQNVVLIASVQAMSPALEAA